MKQDADSKDLGYKAGFNQTFWTENGDWL